MREVQKRRCLNAVRQLDPGSEAGSLGPARASSKNAQELDRHSESTRAAAPSTDWSAAIPVDQQADVGSVAETCVQCLLNRNDDLSPGVPSCDVPDGFNRCV